MKLNDANIRFRTRTDWEAVDLGFRMVSGFRLRLALLWLAVSFPFVFVITLAFWQSPGWAFFLIWWLKPIFEYSSLYVLSISVFETPPPFKACLKESFKLIFRLNTLVDLTWRRFSPYRSMNLPIRQLENLSGSEYKTRARLINHQISGSGPTLTFIGSNIEFILFFGLIAFCWLAINVDASRAFTQNYSSFIESLIALGQTLYLYFSASNLWLVHLNNWLYLLVLTVWGPIYVACGFSTYLNARSKLEAWDVELTFKRMAQRVGKIFCFVFLSYALFVPSQKIYAESLPDEQKIVQQRDDIVNNKPYPTLQTKTEWCFGSCKKKPPNMKLPNMPEMGAVGLFANGFRVVMWVVLAGVLAAAVYYLFRDTSWINSLTRRQKNAPTVMFGMDVTPESLPDNVGRAARKLFLTDPRAALSLLYRASLVQLIHQHDLPLRNGHTEGEVLTLTQETAPRIYDYMDVLTKHWVCLAYGHTLPEEKITEMLCLGYEQMFPIPLSKVDSNERVKHA